MVRIPAIPQLVVRPHEPARMRRLLVLAALLWAVSLAIAGGIGWRIGHRPLVAVEDAQNKVLRADIDTLRQRIAVLERAEQIGKVAANDLQQSLRDRDEEIAGLRADLAFYGRLVGGGARREGLAVHSVQVDDATCTRIVLGDWYEQGSVLQVDASGYRLQALTP